jgi:hypothetical protein
MARAVPLFCVFGFAIILVSSLPTFGDEPESNKPSSSRFVLSEQQKNELVASWDGKLNSRVPKVVRYVFENANAIEIFSLDPRHLQPGYQDQYFRKKILGQKTIESLAQRKLVLGAFDKAVRDVAEDDEPADCFDPHHALRAEYKGKTVYLLICFSCNQVMVCVDDEIKRDLWFMIENWPHVLFNEVCSAEGLPLSESNLAVIEHFYKISPIDDDGKSPVDGDGP